jgi:dipeptidyl aminopeptidase/acylaminoacyl peptidase
VDADGSNARPLTTGSDSAPSWSPDGQEVVFHRNGSPTDVWAITVDNAQTRNLSAQSSMTEHSATWSPAGDENNGYDAPQWNPSGTRVAFVSDRSGDLEVWTAEFDGSDLRNISSSPGSSDQYTRWISDAEIAFIRDQGPNGALFTMNADGSGQTEVPILHPDDAVGGGFTVSSDGTRFAWTSARDGNVELYSANSDGTNVVRVTTNDFGDGYPTFRNCP